MLTGHVFAVEALIRWNHPDPGPDPAQPLHPDRRPDRSHRADRRLGARWKPAARTRSGRTAGLPPIKVCVNVSARQFAEKSFVGRVDQRAGKERPRCPLSRARTDRKPDHARHRPGDRHDERASSGSACRSPSTTSAPAIRASSALKTFPVARLKIDKIVHQGAADQCRRPRRDDGRHFAGQEAQSAHRRRGRRERRSDRLPAQEQMRRVAGIPFLAADPAGSDRTLPASSRTSTAA